MSWKPLRATICRAVLMCAVVMCSSVALSTSWAQSTSAASGPLVCEEIEAVCGSEVAGGAVEYVKTEDRGVAPASVVKACKAQTSASSTRLSCYGVSNKLPSKLSASVVKACGDATGTDGAFLTCLRGAQELATHHVEAVQSCDEITTNDDGMNACMTMLADFGHFSAGRTLEACIASTSLTSSVQKCMSAAKHLTRDHVAIVKACGKSYPTDASTIACIKATASR